MFPGQNQRQQQLQSEPKLPAERDYQLNAIRGTVLRCNHDIEFRLIQCCTTCNRFKRSIPYDRIAPSLVRMNCEDRYGEQYCKKYVSDTDVWTYKQWSCSGYSPYMAFRACRKTCGFCDFSQVHYNLKNATDACKSVQQERR